MSYSSRSVNIQFFGREVAAFVSGKEGRRRRGDVKFQFSNFQLFFSNQGERLCFSSGKEGVGGRGDTI